jgi:cold shock CspA family protein
MFYGVVQKLNRERGFGFIAQDGRRDVYFHATVVEDAAFDKMLPDQPVMFELAKRDPDSTDDRAPQALKVKLIARIPGGILPRPTQDIAPRHHPKARQRKPTWRGKASGSPNTSANTSPRSLPEQSPQPVPNPLPQSPDSPTS